MTKLPLRLILENIRSTTNVGSILRTADAFAVEAVYVVGYTPFPRQVDQQDNRPPHVAYANTRQIAKTALGAEKSVPVIPLTDIQAAIALMQSEGYHLIVLEQAENSLTLCDYSPIGPTALILGNEVDGVSKAAQTSAETILEIPMLGQKESFGVAVAAGIALYSLRNGRPAGISR
ncbi:TrmH family RNA methyltransferase [bacterium]|nr:MAG: TrmH family RNA methyltransferase [bacterium]